MTKLPIARSVRPQGKWTGASDLVVLGHDQRFLRHKTLTTVHGESFVVDLPDAVHLIPGQALLLENGHLFEVVAADEDVLVVTGDLAHLVWHIGNNHAPCQIEADRLLIRSDAGMATMLRRLGAGVKAAHEPFVPDAGTYGSGADPVPSHDRNLVHHHGSHSHPEDDDPEPLPD